MKIRMIWLIDLVSFVLVLFLLRGEKDIWLSPEDGDDGVAQTDLVILAEADDAYAPLADEITRTEKALRLFNIDALRSVDSNYVIYVASPDGLSEAKLLALSSMSAETGRYPAIGIISGSTMEMARQLWLRGREINAVIGVAASAKDVNAPMEEGEIWYLTGDPTWTQPLNKANLMEALEVADYFYWARHVSSTKWFWYEGEFPKKDEMFGGDELPTLNPVVIHTPSCRSFTPWNPESIALAFTDQGAAAYLGNLYSPISSGYFIGHLQTLPGFDTWSGVSMGVLAQVQNRASEKAYATQPYLFMLGDPHLAVQVEAPYTITLDQRSGDRRVIRGFWESAATNPGVLPLRISNGAEYSFMTVTGVGSVSEGDPFFNRSIQTLNIGEDKVALILLPEGDYEIELSQNPPFLRHQADGLRDSFEFVWCSIAPMQSVVALLPVIFLSGFVIISYLKEKPLKRFLPGAWVGVSWALLQMVFCVLRSGKVSVTSYQVTFTPVELYLAFLGTFSLVVLGLTWMLETNKKVCRLFGLGICIAPTSALMSFYFGIITVLNLFNAQNSSGGFWPLNYNPVRMAAVVGILEVMVFIHSYSFLRAIKAAPKAPIS